MIEHTTDPADVEDFWLGTCPLVLRGGCCTCQTPPAAPGDDLSEFQPSPPPLDGQDLYEALSGAYEGHYGDCS